MMKPYLLISACLLGERCRYDGKSKPLDEKTISRLRSAYELVAICPEVAGGLPTPRVPSERQGRRVVRADGADVTENYRRGAAEALALVRKYGIKLALLKERSPSCGVGRIYDGTFSGTLTDGDGTTAELLKTEGIRVIGESEIEKII